jgi:hypothetical protein
MKNRGNYGVLRIYSHTYENKKHRHKRKKPR